MALARIMPGAKGYDIRTFECPKCACVDVITVATDPMKTSSANWQHSDLKPPR
jgi:hypothetical protein